MQKIVIYDPAMCCSTGVCGPSPDPNLIRVAADLDRLAKSGIEVRRYNLSQQPDAFVQNAEVHKVLNREGLLGLPIIIVDDKVRLVGAYPTTAELGNWLAEK